MHRFYLPPQNFRSDSVESDDKAFINQLAKVLRAKHGDKFAFFDDSGDEILAQLTELDKKSAKFLIIDRRRGSSEPKRRVTLYQSLIKKDKFDWVVQKAVELGAAKIVPVISEHCVVRELSAAKADRYEQIIKEATEQCGGVRLAEMAQPQKYSAAIKAAAVSRGAKLIAYEKQPSAEFGLIDADEAHIFIGPEGGYSEGEIREAGKAGLSVCSLGPRILRAETAAVAALSKLLIP